MKIKEGILATLTYSDIFEYPLTLGQIYKYFQGDRPATQDEIRRSLFSIGEIESKQDLFYLKGRDANVVKRRIREEESRKKMRKAKIIARALSLIPTIRLIAVSGSLAQSNARREDDIDLFFVTRKNTVWISRFVINLFLMLIFQKRKKNVNHAPDKICPNMIVSESSLTIPPKARSLYTAREIAQLTPLQSKGDAHLRLLSSNSWIKKLLPNTHVPIVSYKKSHHLDTGILSKIDDILFSLQKKYMKITNEIVKKDIAKFHPNDTGKIVTFLYKRRLIKVLGVEDAQRVYRRHKTQVLGKSS